MPRNAVGSYGVQIFNGSAPVLAPNTFTFSAPLPIPTVSPTPSAKEPAEFEIYFDLGSYQLTSTGSAALRTLAAKISGLGRAISLSVSGFFTTNGWIEGSRHCTLPKARSCSGQVPS
jgi:hypothetical protein